MTKIFLGCMGKYLRGSGAGKIWTDSLTFGVNVVESVLNGRHYVRSLKGMLLLGEIMQRLQWCEFLKLYEAQQYAELEILRRLKTCVHDKLQAESQKLLADFMKEGCRFVHDFAEFCKKYKAQSENFAYWNNCLNMVSLLKDLIRSDRIGNWTLHLQTVQRILPFFAAFDCTNYLRWCSVYLEDMRKLHETAPEVYNKFVDGQFVIERTPGTFKAVGADMCLEQTINKSQKSSGGINGSTRKKQYVAEWELI